MEEEELKEFEARRYENIIAELSDNLLIKEMAIINEEENILYSKKKALKEELKRRLRGN